MTNARQDTLYRKIDRERMPVPSTGIFDYPYYVKRVNVDWYKHISGIVSGLYELSAWIGTDEDIKRAVDEIHAWLSEELTVIENCEQVQDCMESIIGAVNVRNYENFRISGTQLALVNIAKYQTSNSNIFLYNPEYRGMKNGTSDDRSRLCGSIFYWLSIVRAQIRDEYNYQVLGNIAEVAAVGVAASLATGGLAAIGFGLAGIYLSWEATQFAGILAAWNNEAAFNEFACEIQRALSNAQPSSSDMLISAIAVAKSNCILADSDIIADSLSEYATSTDSVFLYLIDCIVANETYTPPSGSDCNCIDVIGDCASGGISVQVPDSNGYVLPHPAITPYGQFGYSTGGTGGLYSLDLRYGAGFDILLDSVDCVRYLYMYARHEYESATNTDRLGLASTKCDIYINDNLHLSNVPFYFGAVNTTNTGFTLDLTGGLLPWVRAWKIGIRVQNASATTYGYIQRVWKIRYTKRT